MSPLSWHNTSCGREWKGRSTQVKPPVEEGPEAGQTGEGQEEDKRASPGSGGFALVGGASVCFMSRRKRERDMWDSVFGLTSLQLGQGPLQVALLCA